MEIVPLVVGSLATNCYLIVSDKDCLIIDPGGDADFISTTTLEKKISPRAILLTHGHFDHCLAAYELKLNFNLPIYLHPNDTFLYNSADSSAKHWTGEKSFKLPSPDIDLFDGQELVFGDLQLKVLHTPGHTPGSVCFLGENNLFTGDLLFSDGVGRTDFGYGSTISLSKSLKKIGGLPGNTRVYPGHEDFGLSLENIFPANLH